MKDSPVTEDDRDVHEGQCDDGRKENIDAFAMEKDADTDGERNLNEARENGGGIEIEDVADDETEDGEDDREGHKEDGEKEEAGAFCEHAASNITDGLSAISDRDHEGTKVMDGADEDGTKKDPKEGGDPTPDNGEGGADDGTCTGDGRKMMAEDDPLVCGDVVSVIV